MCAVVWDARKFWNMWDHPCISGSLAAPPPRPPRTSTAVCTINTPIHFRLYCDDQCEGPREAEGDRTLHKCTFKIPRAPPQALWGARGAVQAAALSSASALQRSSRGRTPLHPRDSNCGSWRLVAYSHTCPGQAREHRLSEHLSVQTTRLAPRLGTKSK